MENQNRKLLATIVFFSTLHPLAGQTEASLIGTGYSAPAPIEVAPGQVVTFFFRGVKPSAPYVMRSGRAQSVPLPTDLAGLSAQIHQLPQSVPYPVPIFDVRQFNDCEEITGRPVCILTAVRIQIPFELTPTIAKLVLLEDGQPSRTFLLRPIRDNAHIVTTCDLTWDTNPGSDCARLAFHANGQPVSETAPAKAGETLVVYAHGFGPTLPRATTGSASPAGAGVIEAVGRQVKAGFQVFRNADPFVPRYLDAGTAITGDAPLFVGLTPNQIGLYQINVVVPPSLELPISCGGDTRSNVLLKIATSQGTENLPLCAVP